MGCFEKGSKEEKRKESCKEVGQLITIGLCGWRLPVGVSFLGSMAEKRARSLGIADLIAKLVSGWLELRNCRSFMPVTGDYAILNPFDRTA
jgi:hypothetical protein